MLYTTKTKCILRWMFVFLIMGSIFFFSAQEGARSKAQTEKILSAVKVEKVEKVKRSTAALSTKAVIVRKIAHFLEYSALALCLYRAISSHTKNYKKNLRISFLICLIYAMSDELHQIFIPGRDATVYDVFIDSSSALLTLYVLSWVMHKRAKKRRIL